MNKLLSIATAAAVIAAMSASCDKVDTQSTDGALLVTGSIAEPSGTRMAFTEDAAALRQSWEVGDHIVGSYLNTLGETVDVDYVVASVNDNGFAIFRKASDFADPAEGTTVYALCLGQNGETHATAEDARSSEGIALGDDVRTIMTARAEVQSGVLNLVFTIKSALIEASEVRIPLATDYSSDVMTLNVRMDGVYRAGSFRFDAGDYLVLADRSTDYNTFNVSLNYKETTDDAVVFGGFRRAVFSDPQTPAGMSISNDSADYLTPVKYGEASDPIRGGQLISLGNVEFTTFTYPGSFTTLPSIGGIW